GMLHVIVTQPCSDEGHPPRVGKSRDFRHDNVPPCQLVKVAFLDLCKLEGLEGHLAPVVPRADCGFGEDHAGNAPKVVNPSVAVYALCMISASSPAALCRPRRGALREHCYTVPWQWVPTPLLPGRENADRDRTLLAAVCLRHPARRQ